MAIPSGAQISDDEDFYLDGSDWIEIDQDSAVELTANLGVANWSGPDAQDWRAFFNAALQGTTAHSNMKPAAQVRLAGRIADQMMHFQHRAGEGFSKARDEVNADPDVSSDVKLYLGGLSIGPNSTWYNAVITSLGTYAQNSTDPNNVAKHAATVADEAFKQDLGSTYQVIWDAYNRNRQY
jgi:hypothetical protein